MVCVCYLYVLLHYVPGSLQTLAFITRLILSKYLIKELHCLQSLLIYRASSNKTIMQIASECSPLLEIQRPKQAITLSF